MENKVESSSSGGVRPKEHQSKTELSKLSSKNLGIHCDKSGSKKKKLIVQSDSESILIVVFQSYMY